MIAWLAMIVATVASATSASCNACGHSMKNGLAPRVGGAVRDDSGLTGVVQHQRRQNQTIPGETNRPRPEMPHVGIERLSAGRAQKYCAQDQKAGEAVPEQIIEPVAWIECHEHARVTDDPAKPKDADCHKP